MLHWLRNSIRKTNKTEQTHTAFVVRVHVRLQERDRVCDNIPPREVVFLSRRPLEPRLGFFVSRPGFCAQRKTPSFSLNITTTMYYYLIKFPFVHHIWEFCNVWREY